MKRLLTIKKYGHKIGLHYTSLGLNSTHVAKLIHNKRELLETIIDYPVTMMAKHEVEMGVPIDDKVMRALNYIGLRDINKYLHEYHYISDSAQYWREGCMCQHVGKYNKLMVLTHPIWWNERHKNRGSIIADWHSHEVIKRQNIYKQRMIDLSLYDKKVREN